MTVGRVKQCQKNEVFKTPSTVAHEGSTVLCFYRENRYVFVNWQNTKWAVYCYAHTSLYGSAHSKYRTPACMYYFSVTKVLYSILIISTRTYPI